jgi:hypothetical protein
LQLLTITNFDENQKKIWVFLGIKAAAVRRTPDTIGNSQFSRFGVLGVSMAGGFY